MLLQHAVQLPEPRGYVNDFANVIPAEQQQRIQSIIDDVRTKSGGDIVVVTLPDIGDEAPSDVALQIGRTWKVGKFGKPGDPTRNNGVIILVQPKESASSGRGQCYIGVGYGAEGFITDATSGQLCRDAIPSFRQGDYATGIEMLTSQVAQRFADEYHFTLDSSLAVSAPARAPSGGSGQSSGPNFFFIIIFLFIVFNVLLRSRAGCVGCLPLFLPNGRGWGGSGGWSGGGGGFSGGGGGGFGGVGGGGGFGGGGGGSSW